MIISRMRGRSVFDTSLHRPRR